VLVEIAARGAIPTLTPIRTGGLTWLSLGEQLTAAGDLGRLRQRIEALADPAALLDLKLSGILYPAEHTELTRLREIAQSRWLHVRIDDSQLIPPPSGDWLEDLPAGLIRDVARELQLLTDPATPRPGREQATPQVAQRSLLELYALLQEGAE
jgi:hypothetical protein